jgi:hypothetical protein
MQKMVISAEINLIKRTMRYSLLDCKKVEMMRELQIPQITEFIEYRRN